MKALLNFHFSVYVISTWHHFYTLLCVLPANSNYELGRGDKVGGWRPKPVPSLEDVCIIQIASGGYHSLALTGKIIAKLHNWCGNLIKSIPHLSSGSYHSRQYTNIRIHSWCIISDEGKVLSWGYGGCGQLGHSSTENQEVPLVIEALADEHIVYIACGGSSSAAVTGKKS